MNKNLRLFVFLVGLALMGFGVIWGVVIYFDNWHRVMSDYDQFELYKFSILSFFVGFIIEKYGKMLEKKEG